MFGGTFTDRVLVSGENVLAKAKAFTLEDFTGVKCQGYGSFDNIIPKK